MNDALRNPIVIGNRYGYSTSTSGIIGVTIGTAVRIVGREENKVTLEDLSVQRYLYGNPCDDVLDRKPNSVSVYTCHVFPIHEGSK